MWGGGFQYESGGAYYENRSLTIYSSVFLNMIYLNCFRHTELNHL